jgi:copper(I)-binding protein
MFNILPALHPLGIINMKRQQSASLRILSILALAFSLGLSTGNVNADDTKPASTSADNITVEIPEVRSTPPGQKITGAFMTLKNTSATDIKLVAAQAEIANVTEIHESGMKDGVMYMNKVENISVPANGSVELKPGGFHIMLIDLKNPLTSGEKANLTLTFSDNSQKTVEAAVVDVSK